MKPSDEATHPDEDFEKTELAWDRSVLALGAVGLLLLKRVVPIERTEPVAGWIILGMAAGLGLVAFGYRRQRRVRPRASRSALKLVSVSTAIIGLISLGLALAV